MKTTSLLTDSGVEDSAQRLSSSLSEINVVPLVDVVLVLLLIFMLTAPMMYRGIDVHLPKSRSSTKPTEMDDRLILTLTRSGEIFLNEKPVSENLLKKDLKIIFKRRKDKTIYFKADRSLSYGQVVEVMNQAHEAGAGKIGMVTEKTT